MRLIWKGWKHRGDSCTLITNKIDALPNLVKSVRDAIGQALLYAHFQDPLDEDGLNKAQYFGWIFLHISCNEAKIHSWIRWCTCEAIKTRCTYRSVCGSIVSIVDRRALTRNRLFRCGRDFVIAKVSSKINRQKHPVSAKTKKSMIFVSISGHYQERIESSIIDTRRVRRQCYY